MAVSPLQVHTVAPLQGLRWIRDGLRLFGRQPFALAALSAFYLLLVLFPTTVPLLGPALAGVVAPFASFGMMQACRETERGTTPTPVAFMFALRSDPPRRQMLRLGVIHAAVLLAVGTVLALTGVDDAIRILPTESVTVAAGPGSVAGSNMPAFQVNGPLLALQFLIFLPLEMAMWFAPVFVGWHGVPAGKAMFFSFFACWRNKWALLVYTLATVLLCALVATLVATAAAALIKSDEILSFLSAPLLLAGAGLVLTTLYPIYRSIVLGSAESPTPLAGR
jgi:hypothetical protein